jgi:peptide subunit release factor RF-3
MQSIRNIAILAHVDAGKTTLSERILFTAGEIGRPGNVEEGLATMDYLPKKSSWNHDRGCVAHLSGVIFGFNSLILLDILIWC